MRKGMQMKMEELLGGLVPVAFFLMWFFESRLTGRNFPTEPAWRRRGLQFFTLTLALGGVFPLLWQPQILREYSLVQLDTLGVWGAVPGVLSVTLISYWLHRAQHQWVWLWRLTHRLHHRPKRVDLLGAFYSHPLEVVIKVSLGVIVSSYLLGLAPSATALVGLVTALLSLFQHWNIHTPVGIGYVVQRPESHALHHAALPKVANFSDLPVWDMVFGTFQNPRTFEGEIGLAE
jgi:sterol desaturase/sphingolipid hydroxylase (fatty acid hydroxylase superfamily)